MFDTPNGGFFYSYIVVLGHYSRVILCLVLGFVVIYHSCFESIHNPYKNDGKALT